MTNPIINLRSITGGLSRAATESSSHPVSSVEVSNTRMIAKLIGKPIKNAKQENMLAVMRAYAEEVKGKFDEEDHAIDVEGEDGDLTIYGLVQTTEDDETYIEYQCIVEMHDPRRFYTGDPATTISAAIKNVKMK